jgi:hypothetical protein
MKGNNILVKRIVLMDEKNCGNWKGVFESKDLKIKRDQGR